MFAGHSVKWGASVTYGDEPITALLTQLWMTGPAFDKRQILDMWLVEMAISTNHVPKIWVMCLRCGSDTFTIPAEFVNDHKYMFQFTNTKRLLFGYNYIEIK